MAIEGIIAASSAGAIGLFALGIKLYKTCKKNKKTQDENEENPNIMLDSIENQIDSLEKVYNLKKTNSPDTTSCTGIQGCIPGCNRS